MKKMVYFNGFEFLKIYIETRKRPLIDNHESNRKEQVDLPSIINLFPLTTR